MRPFGSPSRAQLPPQLSASRRVPRPLISWEIGKAVRGGEAPARRPAVAETYANAAGGAARRFS
jgi:hypothetical protein